MPNNNFTFCITKCRSFVGTQITMAFRKTIFRTLQVQSLFAFNPQDIVALKP